MRRLSMETAEATAPDAALMASRPRPGTPGRAGAVAHRSAAWRDGGRPKPPSPDAPAVHHQWWINRSVLQGLWRSKPLNNARGTPEGPADLRFHCSGMLWCREMPGSAGLLARGVPRPLGLSLIQVGD